MRPPAISLVDLSVAAGARRLLDHANLRVAAGELCLIVGASGSGKSVTLGLIAGLVRGDSGLTITGTVEVLGRSARGDAGARGCAVVFQDFALFDDLDARGNLEFAADHADPTQAARPDAGVDTLLNEFGLRGDMRPAKMSGGQRQRLAIARALAFRPELMLYDEPTSGLDPALADEVVERIRAVHDKHGMTSLIVTHDLAALMPIADRIILLDPDARTFRDVPRDGIAAAVATLHGYRVPADAGHEAQGSWWARAGYALLDGLGATTLATVRALKALLPRPPHARWGGRFLMGWMRLLVLGSAIPFIALAGTICGFVVAFFIFKLLPYAGYTSPVVLEEFIGALGYALFRVVVPGVLTLLFASRAGAAIAADLGHRVYTRQLDAMRVHGVAPDRYLFTGALWAGLLGAPFLLWIAWKAASLAAAIVFLGIHPNFGAMGFDAHFLSLLAPSGASGGIAPAHVGWAVAKVEMCVFGTVAIAVVRGSAPKASGNELARGVTATIIRATIFVLLVHLAFAFVEF